MNTLFWISYWAIGLGGVAATRSSILKSLLMIGVLLFIATLFHEFKFWPLTIFWGIYFIAVVLFTQAKWRRRYFTQPIFKVFQKTLPKMSETEKTALMASTPWWETELFGGNPDWQKLLGLPKPSLTKEEQDFLDGPVERLCQMANNWEIAYQQRDLPPEIWEFLKAEGFMGFIIPKEYGGLGFSGLAHSAIASKIAGHCTTLSTTVSVPNTLGPAELLMHYGTEEQKKYYLPRLAKGLEIPCFALTGPDAGSDAGAIPDIGIITKGLFEGEEIIGIRLNWNKRYITLAPIATVLGLAFKLYDPERLYFDQEELGITCALIPTNTAGITIGRRHLPAGSPFQNGPTQGKDVFIPLSWIIGGPVMAGEGWRMLVECLASGRAITLPASSAGGARAAALVCGAYSRIRSQFNSPISNFEGVQEVLARIAGCTYQAEATRTMTALAVNLGEKPAVPSAIAKYHVTELGRQVALAATDLHAGKAIMTGPKNYIVNGYQSVPIAITVEGANLLTRNMIIFGQGAMRCHPYLLEEMETAAHDQFDRFEPLFLKHCGSVFYHMGSSFLQAITFARTVRTPGGKGVRYMQKMTQASHAFALVSDVSMALLGGKLKFKENLSAKLGDMLSMLYIGSACLKRFYDQGQVKEDFPLFQWAMDKCLADFWQAMDAVLQNFPSKILACGLRVIIMPFGRPCLPPKDTLSRDIAQLLTYPNEVRSRLTEGTFISDCPNNPVAQLEKALVKVIAAEPLEQKIYRAIRHQQLPNRPLKELLEKALEKDLLTLEEQLCLKEAIEAREAIIAVDDFDKETLDH